MLWILNNGRSGEENETYVFLYLYKILVIYLIPFFLLLSSLTVQYTYIYLYEYIHVNTFVHFIYVHFTRICMYVHMSYFYAFLLCKYIHIFIVTPLYTYIFIIFKCTYCKYLVKWAVVLNKICFNPALTTFSLLKNFWDILLHVLMVIRIIIMYVHTYIGVTYGYCDYICVSSETDYAHIVKNVYVWLENRKQPYDSIFIKSNIKSHTKLFCDIFETT